MQSRYNSDQPLPGRDYPVRYPFTVHPRQPKQPARSSKPASSGKIEPVRTPAIDPPYSQGNLVLEQEITSEELNDFSAWTLSQLNDAGAGYPLETIFKTALSQKLESYVFLKSDYIDALEAQKEHHQWSELIVKAAEPVLRNQSIPDDQKEGLSSLAVQCIETTWQLNLRVETLRLRIEFLNQAVPLYLTDYGQQLDTPADELNKTAQQLRAFLERRS